MQPSEISPDVMAELLSVLTQPEHAEGIEERYLTILGTSDRAEHIVRVHARISGTDDIAHWDLPNPAVRLDIPEPPEEFAHIEGIPQNTSRVYTLAEVDTTTREVAIDMVRHEAPSAVMRWLASVAPGDTIVMHGPRPHHIPGEGTPRILLADASAIPAAVRIIRSLPHADTLLVAAINRDEHELVLADLADVADSVRILLANLDEEQPLAAVFAGLDVGPDASVWAGGEREDIREIRRRCKQDLGLPKERTQVFGYWKRGMTNTRIDLARLQLSREFSKAGKSLHDADDLDIEV